MKKRGLVISVLILLAVTAGGCRMKIAGDEYIVGPLPMSSDQGGDRNRNLQEPAPREKERNRKDQPAEEDQK